MATAVVGADKKGGKKRLAPAVMLALLGASLLTSCVGSVEPGVTIGQPEQTATEVQGEGLVIVEPTETVEAAASATRVPAAGESLEPAVYPTRYMPGQLISGQQALDSIALPGTAERALLEAELATMGTNAPTAEHLLALNTTDNQNPSWTYLPGNQDKLYVAVVREGGVEKIDPSLHDWRVGNVSGVELARWQEVTPPPGADNLRLVANGTTTVIGAFQGDTLVYWLSTEANNGQGDWLPNDSNMPEGDGQYSFDAERNTWVTQVGDVVYEYRSGVWNEVVEIELGATRVNPETQITEVYVGNSIYLEAPAHYKPEYVHTDEQGRVRYDAPGLHLFVNEGGEWQVTPFEEVEMNGFEVIYGAGGEYTITSDTAKAEERRREFFVSWVQTEANADYRQEVFGTATPTDEQVWEHLQTNGLLVTDNLKVPFYDTNHYFYQLN